MSTSHQLAPNATARLTMQAGSPCSIAEFAMFLDQYEYLQDEANPHRWYLDEADSRNEPEPPAIVISDLNKPVDVFDVYGQGSEHYTNLNYLMHRAGWESCSVVCQSGDISAKMLARFVSVEVESDFTLPASSLDANEHPPVPPTSAAAAPVLSLVDDSQPAVQPAIQQSAAPGPDANTTDVELATSATNHRVREITIQLNATQERLAISEDENAALRERVHAQQAQVQQLTQQLAMERTAHPTLAAPKAAEPSDARQLMQIIEEHLLPSIDISSAASSKIVADLHAAGYGVQLRLVRTA